MDMWIRYDNAKRGHGHRVRIHRTTYRMRVVTFYTDLRDTGQIIGSISGVSPEYTTLVNGVCNARPFTSIKESVEHLMAHFVQRTECGKES